MTYKELKEALKGLITDSTSEADIEKIGNIANEVDKLEKENTDLIEKHEQLRGKYINAVRNSAFSGENKDQANDTPKTFEECVNEVIENRK